MEEFINIVKDEKEVNMMSPLTWAYIGDCVYELYIRTQLVNTTNLKPHKLHIESIKYVKASAQAEMLHNIYEELGDEEKEIVRRGRNTQNHHLPKNSNVQKWLKKYSNRRFRKNIIDELPIKSNYNRKYTEYWWTLW